MYFNRFIFFVTLFFVSYISHAQESVNSGFKDRDNSLKSAIYGRIIGISTVPKNKLIEIYPHEEELKKSGFIETDNGLERKQGLTGAVVKIGNRKVKVDSDGGFIFKKMVPGEYTLSVLTSDEKGAEIVYTKLVLLSPGEVYETGDIVAFRFDYSPHDSDGVKKSPLARDGSGNISGNEYKKYTCRDYNNRFGNCVNYNAFSAKGLYNFLGSDCEHVLMLRSNTCWRDRTSNPYCNGKRNCSELIGHATTHHCH